MAKRIYIESIKKWALRVGISGGTLIGLIFMYLFAIGAISNVSYSGDSICAGTESDPCYAYINFTANEDIFIYPIGYDPWGRDTPFSFDPNVKSWKLERSWGDYWWEYNLSKPCTSPRCGAKQTGEPSYSLAWRKGKDYQIRITGYKNNPTDEIKWGAFSGVDEIDPTWFGKDDKSLGPRVIAQSSLPIKWAWNITKTGAEEELGVEYEIINDTATEFCIKLKNKKEYEERITEDISNIPISKISDKSFDINLLNLDFSGEELEIEQCFNVNYPRLVEGISFKIGWDTVIVNSTQEGEDKSSAWTHKIFFDPNNDRWHVIYIDDGEDVHSASSSNLIDWVDGIDIEPGSFDYGYFDLVLDVDGANTYLHFVRSRNSFLGIPDYVKYKRMTLTGTTPFIGSITTETPYDISSAGGDSNDDVLDPRITLDSNRCVLIIFNYDNATAPSADDYSVSLIKEGHTCGNGDFDAADLEVGFPIHNIQSGVGYDLPSPPGIVSFGDLDAQLFWIDTDVAGSNDLESVFFNGTSNSVGTQRTLDVDIEGSNFAYYGYSLTIGDKSFTFSVDDGTTSVDVWRTIVKNGALSGHIDTLIDRDTGFGTFTAVIDTRADSGGDIWVFAVDDGDDEDIWYSRSVDNGTTWINQTLWQDDPSAKQESKQIGAYFNNETCDIAVTWLAGTSSPFEVTVDHINTGNCIVPDTCTCPGAGNNWEIDMEDNCNLTSACTLTTGNLSWIGSSGYFNCSAQLNLTNRNAPPSGTTFYFSDGCEVNRE